MLLVIETFELKTEESKLDPNYAKGILIEPTSKEGVPQRMEGKLGIASFS